ncbi:MAG: gamma-glutamyl-gamma-aminobutyrate hydrolase family protein [Pseudomonadota bacterium]
MKVVLVSQRIDRIESYGERRDALDVRWCEFLASAGLLGIPVPSMVDVDALIGALDSLAGLVLTGGNDLSTKSNDADSALRDRTESVLLDRMDHLGLPVVGVCRGMQFLAARAGFELDPIEDHVAVRHEVTALSGSTRFASHAARVVNSFHNYGVYGTAADYTAALAAPDGSIEAIEADSAAVFGVMWHPEREANFHPADIDLFRGVFG